ncbi:phosphoribosylanthranilate isomerase [Cellulosilyticum sp. ST5]|uniref:phosphoribosylanthranilate isomerase n=1 Tax=unclassified Cellulosilyticum TaxID=2643091 RepID=UPI000F8E85E8|nr:phosphoribosylanthranilate isomerase [Cellulosilyticum sp. WCF-2]QEH68132.1 phosphoribosylanthranilate isomerase [Cellulosilyticum sp. WCF-2]
MSKIKICGLKSENDVKIVNKYGPDYVGFILAPSKRRVNYEVAKKLKALLNPSILAVGVFVNESLEVIGQYAEDKVIDVIQLHGDESLEMIKELKQQVSIPVIKAMRIKDEKQLKHLLPFIQEVTADYLLFDTYQEGLYGGSGKSFDWKLLEVVERSYFLAGGIGLHNIEEACKWKPFAIDVSSGVETNGVKDAIKVSELIQKYRAYEA